MIMQFAFYGLFSFIFEENPFELKMQINQLKTDEIIFHKDLEEGVNFETSASQRWNVFEFLCFKSIH